MEDLGIRTEKTLDVEIPISDESEKFIGMPRERRTHMLAWLRDQRNMKCCDWMPAPKERVPARSKTGATAEVN